MHMHMHITIYMYYTSMSNREADPFSLPRALRAIALGRSGHDFDDSASFPRAKGAIVNPVATQVATFLRNRKAILMQVGEYLFPTAPRHTQRDRAKQLFNSLDMHGTVAGFYARWGLDELAVPIYSLRFWHRGDASGTQLNMGCCARATRSRYGSTPTRSVWAASGYSVVCLP